LTVPDYFYFISPLVFKNLSRLGIREIMTSQVIFFLHTAR
jgi:hypothetical protein